MFWWRRPCSPPDRHAMFQTVVLGGGVSANPRLREAMSSRCQQEEKALFIPRPSFCTDNGAMIVLGRFLLLSRDISARFVMIKMFIRVLNFRTRTEMTL